MESVLNTSLKTLITFCYLLLVIRVLGKKQIGQVTFYAYITGITLGNVAAAVMVERDVPLLDGLVGITLWGLLTIAVEYMSLKSARARVVLDGEPSIVIQNGMIMEKALRAAKLNMDDLTMLLRGKNIFAVSEVDYAILEPNGKLSVLLKPEDEAPTRKDLKLAAPKRRYLPTELVVDGKVVMQNLNEWKLTREWLDKQLRQSGVRSAKDVMFAELQSDGSLHVNKKQPTS